MSAERRPAVELEPGRLVARLFVPGRPRTKGSLKPDIIRKGGIIKVIQRDSPLSKAWKLRMVRAMREEFGIMVGRREGKPWRTDAEPYRWPVEVNAFFRFERERRTAQSAPDGSVWPSHEIPWPTASDIGDVDKLWRNVLDALTQAGVYADDALVVGGMPYKRWCRPDEAPGVLIVVTAARYLTHVLGLEREALERY